MIYINARFLTQKMTGVQRFSSEVCKQLNMIRDDLIFLVPSKSIIVNCELINQLNIVEVTGWHGHLWEQITLPKYLNSIGHPLLINLCNTAPIGYKNQIVTHHDITYIHYPKSYSLKFRLFYKSITPRMFKFCKKIITVSNFSKEDISKIYNINLSRIDVIYNAINNDFCIQNNKNNKNYCLAVSSPNLHKNFQRLIDAFILSNTNLELYIIGEKIKSFNNVEYESNSRIKFLGRVNDEELIKLYQNAKFFIFPSLYEGFGIPPLEAQACGCPVIASNAASIPEVLGNSALYFNPLDVNEIKDSIERISSDDLLRENLIKKGCKNILRFSWKNSAIKLNNIIKEVL